MAVKKQLVRREGEKAASKLLIPICVMFVGILIMIIVPILQIWEFDNLFLALLFLYRANLQKGGIWQMMLQKMMMLGSIAKMKLRDLFTDEKGEVNIVAIVILIGIAVILALIFKDQIKALLETLFGTITKKATDAVNSN